MLKVENFVKEEIKSRIEDFEGTTLYLSDLVFELFENENCTGSYTCNSYEAIQWIKDYFEELDEIVEEYKDYFGYLLNPFNEPEKFQVVIILFIADKIINNVLYELNLDTDSEVELNKDIIELLKQSL